jgi:excisionase family DNA binding protein
LGNTKPKEAKVDPKEKTTMTDQYAAFLSGASGGWSEAAFHIGCTSGTLKVWVSKRRVPFVKVGRLTRFTRKSLDEWMSKNTYKANNV